MPFCTNCGHDNPDGSNFCGQCGTPLSPGSARGETTERLSTGDTTKTIPAMVEDRERLWAMVSAADFLTSDEKRQMVGLS